MPTVRFDKAQVMHLLQRYQESDVLWNPCHPKHRDVETKRKIWEKIADEFYTSTLEIKKKIKSLTANYHIERKKMMDGEIDQPSIYYYYVFENIKRHLLEKKLINDEAAFGALSSRSEEDLPDSKRTPKRGKSMQSPKQSQSPKENDSPKQVRILKAPKTQKQPQSPNKNQSPKQGEAFKQNQSREESPKGVISAKGKSVKKVAPFSPKGKVVPFDETIVENESEAPQNPILTPRRKIRLIQEKSFNTIDRVNSKLQNIIHETKEARHKPELSDSPRSSDGKSIKVIMPSKPLNVSPNESIPPLHLKSIDNLSTRLLSYRSENDGPHPLESTRNGSGKMKCSLEYTSSASSMKDEDIFSCMAKVWADKLSQLEAPQRLLAEKAINEIMFQAELGSLDLNVLKSISETTLHHSDSSVSKTLLM